MTKVSNELLLNRMPVEMYPFMIVLEIWRHGFVCQHVCLGSASNSCGICLFGQCQGHARRSLLCRSPQIGLQWKLLQHRVVEAVVICPDHHADVILLLIVK